MVRSKLGGRITLVALTLTVLLGGARVYAGFCPTPASRGFGNCWDKFQSHIGEFPFAITVAESEGHVIVVDLLSGLLYRYSTADIGAAAGPIVEPAPWGPATYYGIAATADQFYWVVDHGSGQMLATTGYDAIGVDSEVALTSPSGGLIGDIAYDSETGNFWGVDIDHDLYFEFDANGVATGNSFSSPGIVYAAPAYGTGITISLDTQTGGNVIDVPVGAPIDETAAQVVRLNMDGTQRGLHYELAEATGDLTWVTGIAYASAGSQGDPVHFIIDGTDNSLSEVPLVQPSFPSIYGLACQADADNNVVLTWQNADAYDSLRIKRNGTTVATIEGTLTTWADSALEDGVYTYSVLVPDGAAGFTGDIDCKLVVGRGRLIQAAPTANDSPYGIAMTDSEVIVADLYDGNAYKFGMDLVPSTTIPSPFPGGITSGIAWNHDDGVLLWYNASNGDLVSSDVNGAGLVTTGNLTSPEGGLIGDITYVGGGVYWACDFTNDYYFEFTDDGAATGEGFTFAGGGHSAGITQATGGFFDFPTGTASSAAATRLVRASAAGAAISELSLSPTTLALYVSGIGYTLTGSEGSEAEYIVGTDTRTVYEVSQVSLGSEFVRGDANSDGSINLVDVTSTLLFLFAGASSPLCQDASDSNDDGALDVNDAIFTLTYIFNETGTAPSLPFPNCGFDDQTPEDALGCENFSACD